MWLSKVCSVLLGLFGFALGLSADFAVLLSALFLAHPVHTESVPQQQLNVGDLKCCLCGKAVLETLLAYQKQLHLSKCWWTCGTDSCVKPFCSKSTGQVLYIVGRADLLCLLLILVATLLYTPCAKARTLDQFSEATESQVR